MDTGASSFDALFEEANDLASQRSFRLAAAKYREAIQLEPRRPVAHFNLGCALERTGETETAAMSFHAAMQRYPEDSSPWAESAAASFNCLTQDSAPTPRATPSWFMSDEALKRLSSRVVAATSDDPLTKRGRLQAITMRAAVLASDATGFKPPWPTGPRTAAELREAAALFQEAAAGAGGDGDLQKDLEVRAAACSAASSVLLPQSVENRADVSKPKADKMKLRSRQDGEQARW